MICCCITFVGLLAIAIKKISSKKSVQPINIQSISARLTQNIQAIQSSRNDEQQNTFELQANVQSFTNSQIINVTPIHLEEEIIESLYNIDTIQPMNLPIEHNEFNRFDVENQGSEETLEAPNQTLCLNNQKFNQNLASFAVLTLLFVIAFTVLPIYGWLVNFSEDCENIILKNRLLITHMLYSLTIILPTFYFILNPKHLTKAKILLFEGL
jgi:hypothetical protein